VTDYHHDLMFGASIPPSAQDHRGVLAAAEAADDLGLDIVSFQDHPYQPGFLDVWTLLSYVAARTERIRLLPNVANVPLRPPAVLARSAAALDILSGGRVELGLGAGYFLDGIASMGGPDRSMVEHVAALAEAVAVIRGLWAPGPPVTFQGSHYRLEAARPGPPPAHPIGIWLGAYKRRMLQLTGRAADGWIPSLGYAAPEDLGRMSRTVDAAAEAAGRDPAAIRRAFNVTGRFASASSGFLQGPPAVWAEQLTALVLEHGVSTFVLGSGPEALADLRRFAEEVAPGVREAVARERERRAVAPPPEPAPVSGGGADAAAGRPAREAARETQRLVSEAEPAGAVGRAGQQTLLAIHNQLRQELARLRDVIAEVADGRTSAARARTYLNRMTMRQNYWTLGAFCAAYCRVVSVHHAIEDEHMFPDLRAADQSLGPILDRLREEHEGIAAVLAEIDAALVSMVEDEDRLDGARGAVDHLSDILLAHLRREEDELLGPIGRLSIRI
jgi:alkanesulfonate monooxygenase SsuD/methylene tetrahydromethanopterin reductase-like flavin-dependent oxidoreductase (luciferase family)/hemerythrin-like domain-containing protein